MALISGLSREKSSSPGRIFSVANKPLPDVLEFLTSTLLVDLIIMIEKLVKMVVLEKCFLHYEYRCHVTILGDASILGDDAYLPLFRASNPSMLEQH